MTGQDVKKKLDDEKKAEALRDKELLLTKMIDECESYLCVADEALVGIKAERKLAKQTLKELLAMEVENVELPTHNKVVSHYFPNYLGR